VIGWFGNRPILIEAMKFNYYKSMLLDVLKDESGQDLIEYALVAALIGLSAVASMKVLSTKVGSSFTSIGTSVTSNI
jgi:pilus assembly protein Flp/PilA